MLANGLVRNLLAKRANSKAGQKVKLGAKIAAVLAIAFGLLLYKAINANGVDPSFASATLFSAVNGKSTSLDSEKLKSLAAWFAGHSTCWRPLIGTPPPANYNLRLAYPNGSKALLGISVAYSADSRGTIYFVPNGASRIISHEELIELFSILES